MSAIIVAPFIFCLLYFLIYFLWCQVKNNFEKEIKKEIVPILCHCFDDAKWSYGNSSDEKIFSDSYIIPNQAFGKFEDVFRGIYKDIDIKITKVIYYCIQSRCSLRTVFNGVVFRFETNKHFTGHTVINPLNIFVLSIGFRKIHLKDIQLDENYTIYTNDEVDAKRIITPEFIKILKEMKVAYNASKFRCAFYNKCIIVALDTNKSLFSFCSLIKPIDDWNQYFQMYEEIESIIKLADYLKKSFE